jgi:Pyruvate/2-oxoacid:ferredoxin oxidoreductase gamma subunit
MEGLTVIGFVFGMVGVVALVRLEILIKTLKEKGILEENYKEE